jgi:hypothetical protein
MCDKQVDVLGSVHAVTHSFCSLDVLLELYISLTSFEYYINHMQTILLLHIVVLKTDINDI